MDRATNDGFVDYYAGLHVPPDVSKERLSQLKRDWSRAYHPDRWGDATASEREHAEETLKKVNGHFDTLLDDHRRAEYDLKRRDFLRPAPEHQSAGEQQAHVRSREPQVTATSALDGRRQSLATTALILCLVGLGPVGAALGFVARSQSRVAGGRGKGIGRADLAIALGIWITIGDLLL